MKLRMRLVFDGFEVDPERFQLWRGGVEVPLEPRVFDLLCYLATRPGRLVLKAELLAHVWQAKTLSDGALANSIGKLRSALGQHSRDSTPIETVRGRGYRWRAVALSKPPPPPAARPEPGAANFVGRRAVLDAFAHALDQQAGFLLITGEAGIGKTRALQELTRLARAKGSSVWRSAAYDGAGAPAYWPWIEILRAARNELGDPVWKRLIPDDPRGVARLVSELDAGLDQPAERFRLFDEVTRFLAAVSGERPRVIILDDLHWADTASLELLAFAAHALSQDERPLLFAVALRDREASATPAQRSALDRLARLGTPIALSGLEPAELSQLAALGPDDRIQRALHRRTRGNPFFVLQILGWLAQRALAPNLANVESSSLPAPIESVIRQRLAWLGEPARAALSAAAVIGDEFDATLLARVLEQSLDDTLRALEPARHCGVIERRAGTHGFLFSHALLREVLYADLNWVECGRWHAKLVETLDFTHERHDVRRLGEIARHSLLAVPCELTRVVGACRAAADAARDASGFEVAAELLSRALHKLDAAAGDDATRCDLLLTLGFDQLCSGELQAAAHTLERGAALAHASGDAQRLAAFACRMVDWLEYGVDDELARLRAEQALAQLPPDAADQRAMLLARVAKFDARARAERFEQAERLAQQRADPSVLIDIAFCRASLRDPTQSAANRAATARYRALVEQHPAQARSMRDRLRLVSAELTDYFSAWTVCDLDAADAALARWCDAAPSFQVAPLSLVARMARLGRALARGELVEVAGMLQAAGDTEPDATPLQSGVSLYFLLLAEARGELAAFSSVELPDLTRTPKRFSSRYYLLRDVWAAWLYALTHRHAAARGALHQIPLAALERMPDHYGDLGLLCMLAEVYAELGDVPAARRLYTQLEPHAQLNAVGTLGESKGSVAHALGRLALALNDHTTAVHWLEQAEAMHARWQMPVKLAQTKSLLATVR